MSNRKPSDTVMGIKIIPGGRTQANVNPPAQHARPPAPPKPPAGTKK